MNDSKFIQDNLIWFAIPVIVAGALLYFILTGISAIPSLVDEKRSQEEALRTKQQALQKLKEEIKKAESVEPEKKEAKSGKVIYEVMGEQFSAEASFGIMFENILANMSNTGVRIRTIGYNYQPEETGSVSVAKSPGYNACELSFTTVSTYSQLQNFFKNLAKEKYLSNINEVYIEPYDNDKSILIAKFKIRIYTKTI